jgi:hypothetical protein
MARSKNCVCTKAVDVHIGWKFTFFQCFVLEEMMGVSEQNKLKESCKNSGRNFPILKGQF